MARGWESKSVELQQSEVSEKESKPSVRLTPEQIAKERERAGVALSRSRILEQLGTAKNPRHREMLEQALKDLDMRLAELKS
jgi:hypothetical protein